MPDEITLIDEQGNFTESFADKLPEYLGDDYYNDPDTKQQPTKVFENIKDLPTAVKKIVNQERVISKHGQELEGRIKIPDDKASEDDIKAYRKAIGVPDSADKYELSIPDGDDAQGYEKIGAAVKEAALEAGVPAKSLSTVWDKVVTGLQAQMKDIDDKGIAIMEQEEKALKDKYKEKYDAFLKTGDDALSKFDSGQEAKKVLETFGLDKNPAIRELLYEIAPLVTEGKTHLGSGGGADGEEGWPSDYQYDDNGRPLK